MALPLRTAVRAVVTDDRSRLLLVRFVTFAGGELWAAPGGGVEPGETLGSAIRRELREEVGLHDPVIGPVIWTRTHRTTALTGFSGQHETFFHVPRPGPARPPDLTPEELRAEGLDGSRWWTLEGLRDGARDGVRFAPSRLPELVGRLVAEGPPEVPVDVGE